MTDMFVQVTVMGQLMCSLVDNNTEQLLRYLEQL